MAANALKVVSGVRGRIIALSLVMAFLILCAVPVIAATKITRVQVVNLEDKVQVGITATGPMQYTVVRSAARILVFDIKGYYTPARPGRVRIGEAGIYSVKYARFQSKPPVTRVVFATKAKVSYTARYLNGQKQLLIDVPKPGKQGTAAVKPAPKPATALAPAVNSTPVIASRPAVSTIAPANTVMGVATPVSDEPEAAVEIETSAVAPTPAVVEQTPAAPAPAPAVRVAAAPVNPAQTSPVHITRRAGLPVANSSEPAKNISLDFHAADINDVLKALSVQSGMNIVSGADVKGQVTVSLNRASVDEALQYVAKLSGFRYAKAGEDTYLVGNNVGSVAPSGENAMVTESVALRYSSTDDIAKMVAEMVPTVRISGGVPPAQGTTAIHPAITSVLLAGTADDVKKAMEVVQKIEGAREQADAESSTELYRIKYTDAIELAKLVTEVIPSVAVSFGPTSGFKLAGKETIKLGLTGGGAGDYEFKSQPEFLALTGSAARVKQAVALLEQVDIKQAQILIQARIVDLNNDAAKELGVVWDWQPFIYKQNVPDEDKQKFPIGTTKGFARQPLGFSAMLDAMVTSGRGRILADPKVAVLEGKPANIFIGDQVKYVININSSTIGTNVTTETANVGVQLQVIGQVNDGGMITLNIRPEVSVISDFLEINANGTSLALPQISTRYTASTIRVKDGQTVVIGGLIRDSDIKNLRKVPFLGDIPFLGNLFRHWSTSKQHSEVVVSITASIMQD